MKFDGSTKYATVIEQFLKKANVKESKYFFGLYLKVAGENVQLLPSWDIATGFPLPSPVSFFSFNIFFSIYFLFIFYFLNIFLIRSVELFFINIFCYYSLLYYFLFYLLKEFY